MHEDFRRRPLGLMRPSRRDKSYNQLFVRHTKAGRAKDAGCYGASAPGSASDAPLSGAQDGPGDPAKACAEHKEEENLKGLLQSFGFAAALFSVSAAAQPRFRKPEKCWLGRWF